MRYEPNFYLSTQMILLDYIMLVLWILIMGYLNQVALEARGAANIPQRSGRPQTITRSQMAGAL